jgi:hypothetical protein
MHNKTIIIENAHARLNAKMQCTVILKRHLFIINITVLCT